MSAQINEHNVAEDAHANRFANYLPLSGGTMTGELVIGNEKEILGRQVNTISFSKAPNLYLGAAKSAGNTEQVMLGFDNVGLNITNGGMTFLGAYEGPSINMLPNGNNINIDAEGIYTNENYTPNS